jgi:plasmid replication initiation protein
MPDKKKYETQVVKHNRLVTGKYRLSIVEQRFMLSVIAKIDAKNEDWNGKDGKYKIDISEVVRLIESRHNGQRAQILDVTENLLNKVVTINLKDVDSDLRNKFKKIVLDDDEDEIDFYGDVIQTNWILPPVRHKVAVDFLNIKIDKFLMPFLIEIKENFTSFSLEEALKLKSKYSIRLLEIIKSIKFKGEDVFLYDDLREMLGIAEDQYKRFSDFKKRVLDVSKKELDEFCDVGFKYQENRKRNKVVSIQFNVYENNVKSDSDKDDVKSVYSNNITEKLKSKKVQHHRKLFDEGLTDDIWLKTFAEESSDQPQHLVTTARRIRDEILSTKNTVKSKEIQAEMMKKNRDFLIDNWDDFEIEREDEITAFTKGGGGINYAREDFIHKLEKYRKK